MYINWFIWIISINDRLCYIKNGGNKNSTDSFKPNGKLPLPQ